MGSVLGAFGSWAQEMERIPPMSCPKVQLIVVTWMNEFLINFFTGYGPGGCQQ